MTRRDIEDIYPLSPAQRGMLFESLSAVGSSLHVEQLSCRLIGELDREAFRLSWQRLVDRHPMLRTAFLWKEQEEPLQVVLRRAELPVEEQDWRGLAVDEQERRLAEYLSSDRRTGFVLSKAPLLRLALFRTADNNHWFVWTHHHVLMDGWCSHLLLRESLALYRSFVEGDGLALAPVRPYGDFIDWLRRRDPAAAEAFWRRVLQGFARPTPIGRAAERSAPGEPGERFGHVMRSLGTDLTATLQALARALRVTLNTVVQGAWALLLSRYSGERDMLFGITISGRPAELEGIEGTVGLFISTQPLRVEVRDGEGLGEWIQALQTLNLEIREHGYAPTGELRKWCDVPPHLPLFESALVYENFPVDGLSSNLAGAALRIGDVQGEGARTGFAVTLLAAATPGLSFKLVFDRTRVDVAAAETMLTHLGRMLERFAAGPGQPLSALRESVPEAEVPRVQPRLSGTARRAGRTYVAPRNLAEEIVAGIWSQVLGLSEVGIEDDFFDLGGHSLVAAETVTRLREAFRLDLRLRHLFGAPTVAALASEIARLRNGQTAERGETELPVLVPDPENRHEPFPLTDIQQAYWIGRGGDFELGNVSTHIYMEFESEGLDLRRLVRAWQALIARHEMLRAVVLPSGLQRILERVPPYEIRVEDLADLKPGAQETAIAELRERMSHQVLPADRWPLFDLRVSRLGPQRIRLHLSFDLLIGDGWSWGLLFRDLPWIYLGHEAALPALDLSFRDYVLAEQRIESSDLYRLSRQYWLDRLPSLPSAPELPLSRDFEQLERPRFVRRAARLDKAQWGRLKTHAARLGLTPSTLLLAAFAEVLGLWSKSPRFTVNLTLFHRLPIHPQVHEIVGDFTSLTLLEIDCASADRFEERARRLQDRLWDDLDHRYFSGVRVLRELARRAGSARAAMPVVFTSTLNLTPPAESAAPPGGTESGLRLEPIYSIGQTPQVLLDHQVQESEGQLAFNWDAVDEAFLPGVLDDMFATYRTLLASLVEGEMDEAVRNLLPPRQRELWRALNDTAGPVPHGMLQGEFEARAAERPEAPAVIAAERTLTYGELERHSRRLASVLRDGGAAPGRLVAVVMEKGWEEVVAVLAVLRAGAAYLPIDAALPEERVLELLDRGGAELALVQPAVEPRFAWPAGVRRIAVDGNGPDEPDAPLAAAASAPTDLAYVIFTSGSTGRPKGVMIDHRGALNTIADVNRRFAVGSGDRVLALSSLSFDLSVYDIFGLLAVGGALVLPEAAAERDPARWLDLCLRNGVTLWNTAPALMEMFVESVQGSPGVRLPELRLCLLSGDWIPPSLPERVRALAPECQVVSLGGATEASIWSISYLVKEVDPGWPSIPYGRPLANQQMLVLDRNLEPRPEWVAGDLYIGGLGLALGYWRDDERTAAAFLTPPASRERLYRTGDLARLTGSGDLEFLGREDLQVKIRGHRIELGEIDAVLEQHPAVRSAVVAAVGEDRAHRQLVAYVVPAAEAQAEEVVALADRIAYLDLKMRGAGLRKEESGRAEFALPIPGPDSDRLWTERRSEREFLDEPVSLESLALLLSCLRQFRLDDWPLPKYRYPSAGSFYPVQTYVYVKPGRLEGLPAGGYYYDPRGHRLVHLCPEGRLDREIHGSVNRPIFDRSAFSIFLIGRPSSIAPAYADLARDFCLIEAGAMSQLLMTVAPDHGLGLCPIGNLEEEAPLAKLFALESGHVLLHQLLGGRPAPSPVRSAQDGRAAAAGAPVPALADQLDSYLRRKLPGYMVPSAVVLLDTLPLNANGKVDRRALPRPELREAPDRHAYTPPRGLLEERLAEIWQEVLGIERVGVHDSFLELGGDSVKAIQVLTRARMAGIELTVRELFDRQTVAGLAEVARRQAVPAGEDGAGETAPFSAVELSAGELEDLVRELGDEHDDGLSGE